MYWDAPLHQVARLRWSADDRYGHRLWIIVSEWSWQSTESSWGKEHLREAETIRASTFTKVPRNRKMTNGKLNSHRSLTEREPHRPADLAPRSLGSLCISVLNTWWVSLPCDRLPNGIRTWVPLTWWDSSLPCRTPWWCHTACWFDWRNQQLQEKQEASILIFEWKLASRTASNGWCFDLLLTATHSFRSSPSGSMTASRRFPEPNVAAACFIKSYWWVPSGIFFFGLKVLEDLLPLKRKEEQNN